MKSLTLRVVFVLFDLIQNKFTTIEDILHTTSCVSCSVLLLLAHAGFQEELLVLPRCLI
jgi:hypothetical protein